MEFADYFRFLAALVLVLGLIGGCAWMARRFGLMQNMANVKGQSRLGVVESLTIDPKHRLFLVRRDGKEHLLLVGESSTLIETGIDAPAVTPFPGETADPAAVATKPAQQMSAPDLLLKGLAYLKERRS